MYLMKPERYFVVLTILFLITPGLTYAAETYVQNAPPFFQSSERVSWAAVFAGVFVALAAHMSLSTLGISIGASAVDPYNREHPIKGIPLMMMGWMLLSGLTALFLGGWIAGRLSGALPFDSSVHGLITWALAVVLMFYLASTSIGHLIGGSFHLLSDGVGSVAQAAAPLLPEAAHMIKDKIVANVPQLDWNAIKTESNKLLLVTEKEALKPGELGPKVDELKKDTKQTMKSVAQNPDHASEEIHALLSKAYGSIRETLSVNDRDAVVKLIVEKSGITKDEANRTLEKWEKLYQEAKQNYHEAVAIADQDVRDIAAATKKTISRIAFLTFLILSLGLIAALIGGNLGSTYTRQ